MKKTALITGGTKGIGLAIARAISGQCENLILGYRSDDNAASRASSELSSLTRNVFTLKGDLGDAAQLSLFIERAKDIGYPDILVNNAGSIFRPSAWLDQSDIEFRKTFDVNFMSAALLIRAFAPKMIERQYGRIINIGSTYAFTGASAVLSYTCAKAALTTLTTAMARQLGKDKITVNCVAPGNIDTEMTASAGNEVVEWVVSTTPVGRLGHPDEVGSAVRYLIDSPFITGVVLPVDGGQILNI